jgi:hypothetical protein
VPPVFITGALVVFFSQGYANAIVDLFSVRYYCTLYFSKWSGSNDNELKAEIEMKPRRLSLSDAAACGRVQTKDHQGSGPRHKKREKPIIFGRLERSESESCEIV